MNIAIKPFSELTADQLYAILKARVDIFVVEQNCPYPELDNIDQNAVHVVISEGEEILAYTRIYEKCALTHTFSIGRVLSTKRGLGLGKKVMETSIAFIKSETDAQTIAIHAQSYAKPFYEKLGFVQNSEEFLEDNIPHIGMVYAI